MSQPKAKAPTNDGAKDSQPKTKAPTNDSAKDSSKKPDQSSSESKGDKADAKRKRNKDVDTALHVIKGAIVSVLGPEAAVTASVEFSSAVKGAIIINYTGEKPTDAHQQKIEQVANDIIKADIPIQEFTMERKAAEDKYSKSKVNHTYIYDSFPVPETITTLSIVEIKDINVNCCQGPHLPSTGGLKALVLSKINSKGAKKLQFSFAIGDAALAEIQSRSGAPAAQATTAAPQGKKKSPPSAQESKQAPKQPAASNQSLLQSTVDQLLQHVATTMKLKADSDKPDAALQQLRTEFESTLATFQNQAYTRGFCAQRK